MAKHEALPDVRMTIGTLARHTGTKTTTLRFYERRGLVRGQRAQNGYRTFGTADVLRVRFIRRAQVLGFTLQEIKGVLSLSDGSVVATATTIRRLGEAKLREIEHRRADLARLHRGIRVLLKQGINDDALCPVLCSLGSAPLQS